VVQKMSLMSLISLGLLLTSNFLFKFFFTPHLNELGPYSLISTPAIFDTLKMVLHNRPLAVLFPLEYEPGRVYWSPTIIIPFYLLYQVLSPFGVYIFTSSLLLVVTYLCSWKLCHSHA